MIVSRRNALAIMGASGVAAFTSSAWAQDSATLAKSIRPLMAGRWEGTGSTPSDAIEGGKFIIHLSYHFELGDDGSLGGDYRIETHVNDDVYRGSYGISGYVTMLDKGAAFVIRSTQFQSGSALPDTLFWQGMTGTLILYRDQDRSDNYLLDGTMTGERDNAPFKVQLSYS